MRLGPRVTVKTDEQSSIGRGGVLYGAHFRPEMSIIVWASTRTNQRVDEVQISEGHRNIRDTRDLHEEFRAFDLTFFRGEWRLREEELQRIAAQMRIALGPDYDIVVHDTGSGWHIHVELDPK